MTLGILARHPALAGLSDQTTTSGTWERWRSMQPCLQPLASLDEAVRLWRSERSEHAYRAVAALARLASRRGSDDEDAALAVLVLLQDGIDRLAAQMQEEYDLDDVVTAVWEEIKAVEPAPGPRAARFLLSRARRRLLSPDYRLIRRGASHGPVAPDHPATDPDSREPLPTQPDDEAAGDLADLLAWASGSGVIGRDELGLLRDLVGLDHLLGRRVDVLRLAGRRHGMSLNTVRRRRDDTVNRLRTAVPAYLASVS